MITIWAPDGLPEIAEGTDLATCILDAVRAGGEDLADGDILVVTSKIVSKAEGRTLPADQRDAALEAETVRVVAARPGPDGQRGTVIVENRLGVVGAAAGIDGSNTVGGTILLLPLDPDASARRLCHDLRAATGRQVGVIISDTLGRPWREGQTDIAIGAAGVQVWSEVLGQADPSGNVLAVTRPCIADELAGAGDLVKGKLGRRPVAVVRGLGAHVGALDLPGARSIVRDSERDMFRLGAAEAYRAGFAAGRAFGLEHDDGATTPGEDLDVHAEHLPDELGGQDGLGRADGDHVTG